MKLLNLDIRAESDTRVVTEIGDTNYFIEANVPLTPNIESALSVVFFPTMENQFDVAIAAPVDKCFKENLDKLAAIASKWWGWNPGNPFSMRLSSAERISQPGGALFFTGGVDSFCSLLRHPGKIKGL